MSYAPLEHIAPFKIGNNTFNATTIAPAVGFSGVLSTDLAENPSWIAYWGAMTAQAKREHDEIQAAYRRARETWSIARRAQGKTTEKALDEEWRVQPSYQGWYDKINTAEHAWNAASYVYEAVTKKSFTLAAMAKVQLDELAAIARAHGQQGERPR